MLIPPPGPQPLSFPSGLFVVKMEFLLGNPYSTPVGQCIGTLDLLVFHCICLEKLALRARLTRINVSTSVKSELADSSVANVMYLELAFS